MMIDNFAPQPLQLIHITFLNVFSVIIKIGINATTFVNYPTANLIGFAGDRFHLSHLES